MSRIVTMDMAGLSYTIAAIPLAALGFLNPMIAASAMAVSSLSVVGNSLRIRRGQLS